jgi:hypothetical protein
MLALAIAALLQAGAPAQTPASSSPAPAVERDSSEEHRHRHGRPAKRVAVTAQHLATAFKDGSARAVLLLARDARTRQDSALRSYDATTYQRTSAGVSFTKLGRERLAFRNESSTKVRWRRGTGAHVQVTGSRTVMPALGKSARVNIDRNISPIPYYPGSETLWIGASAAASVDENEELVHPLANGAEAYYTYEAGDSATFRLPDGRSIRLRELKIRPRSPKWNLAVGSLWFDLSGGQLVRAAYRMSVPMDIGAVATEEDSTAFDDVPAVIKPLLFPMKAEISAIGVEYGLHQGRFWLPRVQVAQGGGQMGFVRVPFKLEQKFTYENVNAGEALAPFPIETTADSGSIEGSITIGDAPSPAMRDSMRTARRAARRRCDESGNRTRVQRRRGSENTVFVTIPCDSARLANSPDLPPSIYDEGDEVVNAGEIESLVSQALGMGAQAEFAPQPPVLMYAPMRYNRVEGLSVGGQADQQLGAGYSARVIARVGVADREPNAELRLARSDLQRTLSITGYNRLVSVSDWGNPLSTGSSISAFLFGRDEGFYHRASGVELGSTPDVAGSRNLSWTLFAEQQRPARQKTTFSLARAVAGSQFEPNIDANRGAYFGARSRITQSIGLDPQGLRFFGDLRLETARGDTGTYGRAALDLTMSHGIGNGAASLTLAGGSSVGVLPIQRNWFLGGSQTVRGQRPATGIGNAFWMTRAEVAHGIGVIRPVLFGDLGWAGDRTTWREIGKPLAGVGAGFSVMDGLVRFDVARGLQPEKQWRVDAYIEGRF